MSLKNLTLGAQIADSHRQAFIGRAYIPISILKRRHFHCSSPSYNKRADDGAPLVHLKNALLPGLHSSTTSLSFKIGNESKRLWAVIAPASSSGPGATVLASLLSILAAKVRPQQNSDVVGGPSQMHPNPHPFAKAGTASIGLSSFSKQQVAANNEFQDFSKRYGAMREEDKITLFETLLHSHGFETGAVAAARLVPDKLSEREDDGVDPITKRTARETRARIERLAPLLGLHKPGPGSPGGQPLLHQPVISLSNGQMRRARILSALVELESRNEEAGKSTGTTLLVLDQPYSGLDEPSRDELSSLVAMLHEKGSPRVVLVLRRQDDIPETVTDLIDVRADGSVWIGPREEWNGKTRPKSRGLPGIKNNSKAGIGIGGREEVARLANVRVQYGEKVILDSIDLRLARGSRLVVKGANGSGKTTLLSLLSGTHPQSYSFDEANYTLFGKARSAPANATRILHKRIGYFGPDLLAAFPRKGLESGGLTVGDAIATGFEGVFSRIQMNAKQKDRLEALAEQFVPCLGFRNNVPRLESGDADTEPLANVRQVLKRAFIELMPGSQALVLFLRAVIHQPELLILDEPFQGMDATQIALVHRYLDGGAAKERSEDNSFAIGRTPEERAADVENRRKSALVLVSHYVSEWPETIGEYIFLQDGKIVERF